MPDELPTRVHSAQSAPKEDLQALIHESDEETLLALLENPHVEEPHISQMLERLDLSANVLTAIAEKGKWTASEGVRLRLARRGPARVVGALLAEGHPQAIKLALANAFLTESQILKVLAKPGVPERVVAAISQHPRWAVQYNIRVALVRNQHTPMPVILAFLPNLTLRDLKDLATLEGISPHVRRYILKELSRRPGAK